ncbi:hypothetical protein G9A89_021783 [Geosiphon pyriformis]|nr:hypothetical protein G9A89_021783 [Geosiphon pyriformis]
MSFLSRELSHDEIWKEISKKDTYVANVIIPAIRATLKDLVGNLHLSAISKNKAMQALIEEEMDDQEKRMMLCIGVIRVVSLIRMNSELLEFRVVGIQHISLCYDDDDDDDNDDDDDDDYDYDAYAKGLSQRMEQVIS